MYCTVDECDVLPRCVFILKPLHLILIDMQSVDIACAYRDIASVLLEKYKY
mgnify:FL=1